MNSPQIRIYPYKSHRGNTAIHPRLLSPDNDHAVDEFISAADKFVYLALFSVIFAFVSFAIVFLLALGA